MLTGLPASALTPPHLPHPAAPGDPCVKVRPVPPLPGESSLGCHPRKGTAKVPQEPARPAQSDPRVLRRPPSLGSTLFQPCWEVWLFLKHCVPAPASGPFLQLLSSLPEGLPRVRRLIPSPFGSWVRGHLLREAPRWPPYHTFNCHCPQTFLPPPLLNVSPSPLSLYTRVSNCSTTDTWGLDNSSAEGWGG